MSETCDIPTLVANLNSMYASNGADGRDTLLERLVNLIFDASTTTITTEQATGHRGKATKSFESKEADQSDCKWEKQQQQGGGERQWGSFIKTIRADVLLDCFELAMKRCPRHFCCWMASLSPIDTAMFLNKVQQIETASARQRQRCVRIL